MPKRVRAEHEGLYVEVPCAVMAGLRQLAKQNGRDLRVEVIRALVRHLNTPPVVTVTVDEPDLPPEQVERPALAKPAQKAKRGRKKEEQP